MTLPAHDSSKYSSQQRLDVRINEAPLETLVEAHLGRCSSVLLVNRKCQQACQGAWHRHRQPETLSRCEVLLSWSQNSLVMLSAGSWAALLLRTASPKPSGRLTKLFVHSILYQRGIYPPESFEQHKKYGLSVMISADHGLVQYMNGVLPQMSGSPSAFCLSA